MLEAVALILIGVIIDRLVLWYRRAVRVRNNFYAIRIEVDVAHDFAEQFLDHNKIAPSYRLPVMAYQVSLSTVLAEGAINETDAKVLVEFYTLVDSINRGLDLVASLPHTENTVSSGNLPMLMEYNSRNRLKAEDLNSVYENTRSILDNQIDKKFLGFIPLDSSWLKKLKNRFQN